MRLDRPRVPPVQDSELDEEQRELLERFERDGRVLNIFRTLVRHPKLLKRWAVFGNHLLYKSNLPPREREIAILRTAWRCYGEYEWGQHLRIGRQAGLEAADIDRIAGGPESPGLEPLDALLLRAVDELHAQQFLAEPTWEGLSEHYSTEQILDLIFTVGQYTMLAMALNSLGVQLEEGAQGFDPEHAPTLVLPVSDRS